MAACLLFVFTTSPSHADAVDDRVKAEMQREHVPGVALAVIRNGKAVKVRGYGVSNVELNTPVTPDTMFKIASLSKAFLATGVMMLVADGKLALDDPLRKHIDDVPAAWQPVTVAQLMNHTSGLPGDSPGFDPLRMQSEIDVIRKAYAVPLRAEPGAKSAYSNLGYFVLAEIVSRTSGKRWPDILRERILEPLRMTATRPTDAIGVVPRRASGYVFRDGAFVNAPLMLAVRPSGALLSNLTDLVKWDAALTGARILPRATLEQMWTPAKLNDGSTAGPGPAGFGFGWFIDEVAGHRRVRHGGALPGFRAEYARFPDDRLSIIVLTNSDSARPEDLAVAIASHYIADLRP